MLNFYPELKKKKRNQSDENDVENTAEYKNSTLRAIRAVLVRYFKDTRRVDIIHSEMVIKANDMFLALTNINKEKGLGYISSYPPIVDTDMKKLRDYFKVKCMVTLIQESFNTSCHLQYNLLSVEKRP